MVILFYHDCDNCGGSEERIFTDSWTGKELCLVCLHAIVGKLTFSPGSEKDNLEELLEDTFPRKRFTST